MWCGFSFSRLDCDLRDLRGISSLFGISGSREKLRFDKGKYVFVARRRMGFSPFFGRGGKNGGGKGGVDIVSIREKIRFSVSWRF